MSFPPREIRQADAVTWDVSLPLYPAASSWLLVYSIACATQRITVPTDLGTAVDAGLGEWTITLPAIPGNGSTSDLSYLGPDGTAGGYTWTEYVQKSGGADRITLRQGNLVVLPDLEAVGATTGLDARSTARRHLEALETVLLRKAGHDRLSYSIAGRAITSYSWGELRKMWQFYRSEVDREDHLERIKRGDPVRSNLVKARFVGN